MPTADGENISAAMSNPVPEGSIEPNITHEPEGTPFDQVCEPGDTSIAVGVLVEYEGIEASPAHPTPPYPTLPHPTLPYPPAIESESA